MTNMDLLEQYIHYYIDSIKVIAGEIFATELSFEQWKLEQCTEIRCVKNGHGVVFEVPSGKDPEQYAKMKLKQMYKKNPYRWEYQTVI